MDNGGEEGPGEEKLDPLLDPAVDASLPDMEELLRDKEKICLKSNSDYIEKIKQKILNPEQAALDWPNPDQANLEQENRDLANADEGNLDDSNPDQANKDPSNVDQLKSDESVKDNAILSDAAPEATPVQAEIKTDMVITSMNSSETVSTDAVITSPERPNGSTDNLISIDLTDEKTDEHGESFDSSISDVSKLLNSSDEAPDVAEPEKQERMSTSSDVQIVDDSEEKEHKSIFSAETISLESDTMGISDSPDVHKNPHDSTDSYKLFKSSQFPGSDGSKLLSPVCLSSDMADRIHFITPAYSTPNEMKKVPNTNADAPEFKALPLSESTESLTNLSPIYKKFTLCVELSTMLLINKEQWSGEILNVACNDFNEVIAPSLRRLESPGIQADISKSTSPTSSSSSISQFALKQSRHSTVSTTSSSSIASSASTLARKLREGKLFSHLKKDEGKLSAARIAELKQRWLNTDEIYKMLDFIDKAVLNADSIVNEESFTKIKPPEEKEMDKLEKIVEASTPVTNKTRSSRGRRQAKVKFAAGESDTEVPKKRQRRVDSTDVPCTSSNFSEGDSVFAKWGDRKFYAATLGEQTTDGKWLVHFFDGDKKTLLEEFLIKAEEFTMVGHNVYASQGDDNFTSGIITGCELKDGVLQYIVARDKGDISVPCQFIYITESQARQIRGKTTPSTATRTTPRSIPNLANVNKRSTRSKTRLLLADSPKPSSSGTQQAMLSDSDDDGNDNLNEMNLEDVAGVEPESHGVYENGIKLKGKAVTGKMRFARAKATDKDANILGPIPDEGSKYFKNLHVILTCTRPQSPKLNTSDASKGSGSDTCTDSENYKFALVPFVKERLRLQLEAGGATVYNSFDEIPQKHYKNTYLISNRPNTSAKYIQSIATGIKCACHQWVIRCCTEKKRCPVQELPLGWSVETKKYYSWFNKKTPYPLKKMNLLIVDTSDKNYYKFWSKVCKLAEANVAKLTRDSNLEQVYAVICESGYRDDHVERVISHNIPLLTSFWLIQSLLHGDPRPFDNHKSYRADYVDSD